MFILLRYRYVSKLFHKFHFFEPFSDSHGWIWSSGFCDEFGILFSQVFDIENPPDSCDWNGEDNSENSTERSTDDHHDKYQKRREVERFTHNIWYEKIIFDSLNDNIENRDRDCRFPPESKSDDECWYEGDDWSDIGNKFHNPTNQCKGKCLLGINPENELEYEESNIRYKKYAS